jgi:hypothetical protein
MIEPLQNGNDVNGVVSGGLKSEGIGLVGTVRMGLGSSRHGLGLGKPDPGIELARQFGLEIM